MGELQYTAGNSNFSKSVNRTVKILSGRFFEEMKQFKTDGITAVGTVSQLKDFCLSVKKKFSVGFQLPALE